MSKIDFVETKSFRKCQIKQFGFVASVEVLPLNVDRKERIMLRKLLSPCFTLWLLTAFSIQSPAQSLTSGVVTGTVTDATGASVPRASVTLTNIDTNIAQKATASAEGTFRFAFVTPGNYKLEVSATGFQSPRNVPGSR